MDTNRNAGGKFIEGNSAAAYTPEEIEDLLEAYCLHRANGFDKQSFRKCDYDTIEKHAKSTVFGLARIREAEAKGWFLWETIMRNVAFGLDTEIPFGTDASGNRITKLIEPGKGKENVLMFAIRSKMREVYGDNIKVESKAEVVMTTPIRIVSGSGEVTDLNIGFDSGQQITFSE